MKYFRLILVLFFAYPLGACTPIGAVVGVGAVAGVAAYQERGIDGVARDIKIATRIKDRFFQHDHKLLTDIGIEVYESRVLLTGHVADENIRATAVRLSWQADGVQEVINEIIVTPDGSIIDTARDAWITGSLQSKITFDDDILAINYAAETVGGVVYLIGIAQSEAELERVKNHARSISYVQRIISHVRIKQVE
ncbi:MAG: BON domain-containing protein [Rhodospirillaceae bacterium]|nr:BON domain-containing protein [Rhodospirillaceae bacterium]